MKRNKTVVYALFFMLLLILYELYSYIYYDTDKMKMTNVSLLVYGNSPERWESLKVGAEQAAKDSNAEINFVTMTEEDNPKEQINLVKREVKNGSKAILIAVCDSKGMAAELSEIAKEVPIVTVESGTSFAEGKLRYLSGDNYGMGKKLAESVIHNENRRVKIAIIKEKQQRDSVSYRYVGFHDTIQGYLSNLVYWEQKKEAIKPTLFIQQKLAEEAVDIVVALDNTSLEAVIDATNSLHKKVKIYGIGNTDKAVYYLDNGTISSLVYQNEFSIGYLGTEILLNKRKYKEETSNNLIEYRVMDKKSMYTQDNQRMLFPFVK